ncbi:MAG: biotin synthase BioB, partial [Gammaproteobacteria bacterium]|nr:biotin synthase BioB [Gammaproteobacteria bacterium]
CGYCSQSSKYNTELEPEKLLPLEQVIETAQAAKDKGATRFCMGAAWRNPTDTNLDSIIDMIEAVHDLNMESCVTLGMLNENQARRLRDSGLNYYNHNLDTSPEFYGNVITTRTYQDRLDTLEYVRAQGINICSGGILGMGESRKDRASMLRELSNLPKHPESVPINMLVQVEGTPLYGTEALDPFEFVRIIAVARILMPESNVRLSAGRTEMNDEMQSLCFLAGANSMFDGDRLLTTDNPDENRDHRLFERLGMQFEQVEELADTASSAQA